MLEKTGLNLSDIDHIVYHEDPFNKFSRVLSSSLSEYPHGSKEFAHSMKSWIGKKLWTLSNLESRLDSKKSPPIYYLGHHFSHALQAFLGSGFESSAILIVDAVGDWSCSALFQGSWRDGKPEVQRIAEVAFPHSLGLAYSAITAYLGFAPNENECNTMALGAFGTPRYFDDINQIMRAESDGLYSIDTKYFNFTRYYEGGVTELFIKKFGPPRDIKIQPLPFHSFRESAPVDPAIQRFADIAASTQRVLENRIVEMAQKLRRETGESHLCFAGGVALNCVANSALLKSSGFDQIFIPPDPGDGGTSVGSSLYASCLLNDNKTTAQALRYDPYLGTSDLTQEDIAMVDSVSVAHAKPYSIASQESLAKWNRVTRVHYADRFSDLCETVSQALIERKIVGWYQGSSEFGPRALGNRSILVRPDCLQTAERLSKYVKKRAGFRPYALSMTDQTALKILDCPEQWLPQNRWMQYSVPLRQEHLTQVRAGAHADATTRPQVCYASDNARYHQLISTFGKHFGLEVLLNTSFNASGYPIVTFLAEALAMFYRTDMDLLVIGDWLLSKEE